MARRGRPPRDTKARPAGQALTGEVGLVAAFLAQVLADARSDNAFVQAEARQFLQDQEAVRFWTTLGGIDDAVFLERVRRWLL
jgi:hypothetical protein